LLSGSVDTDPFDAVSQEPALALGGVYPPVLEAPLFLGSYPPYGCHFFAGARDRGSPAAAPGLAASSTAGAFCASSALVSADSDICSTFLLRGVGGVSLTLFLAGGASAVGSETAARIVFLTSSTVSFGAGLRLLLGLLRMNIPLPSFLGEYPAGALHFLFGPDDRLLR
jgi:hypothetical protein